MVENAKSGQFAAERENERLHHELKNPQTQMGSARVLQEQKNLEIERRNFQQYKELEQARIKKRSQKVNNSELDRLQSENARLQKLCEKKELNLKQQSDKLKRENDQMKRDLQAKERELRLTNKEKSDLE